MADDFLGSILGGMGGSGGGIFTLIFVIVLGLGSLALAAGIIYFFWRLKAWNLKVEFKLPRSIKYMSDKDINPDEVSGFVDWAWGKGHYDSKTGVVWLKRRGKRKVAMKPFNLARYLQGSNLLTVVQIGADEFRPVIPESYTLYEDEKGDNMALLRLRTDVSESKAWRTQFEREAKKAYSIMGLLEKYAMAISIGLVIFLWGVQLLIVLNRLK